MQIPILVEPAYYGTFWCRQTLNGMNAEAGRKKYACRLIDGERYDSLPYDEWFRASARLVIVVGTSISWVPRVLEYYRGIGVGVVLVSFEPPDDMTCRGVVRMNYADAMLKLLNYLEACGKKRVALYAFNPNSSADQIKERFFINRMLAEGARDAQRHCYHNMASLTECFKQFLPRVGEYDALICANDVTAVSAIRHLAGAGVRVPEDMFLLSFGDTMLARATRPTITSASLDHEKMGQQAITLYNYLLKQTGDVSSALHITCTLRVRQSTMGMPAETGTQRARHIYTDVNFYSDPEATELLRAENFLCACDELDLDIISALKTEAAYEDIAENLSTTVSTIKYRIRKMQTSLGADTRDALIETLNDLYAFAEPD